MATTKTMDPAVLRQLLSLAPDTGRIVWRDRPISFFPDQRAWKIWNTKWAGRDAFDCQRADGYKDGKLLRQGYLAHRIIWALHYGEWPADQIDHINGVRNDNRIVNLRSVTNLENNRNRRLLKRNKSGVTGVCWDKQVGKWRVGIKSQFRSVYIGIYSSFEDAVAARSAAEFAHGYHENHGKP